MTLANMSQDHFSSPFEAGYRSTAPKPYGFERLPYSSLSPSPTVTQPKPPAKRQARKYASSPTTRHHDDDHHTRNPPSAADDAPAAAQIVDLIRELQNAVAEASRYYEHFLYSYEREVESIRPYAPPRILTELWQCKILDRAKRQQGRSVAFSEGNATEAGKKASKFFILNVNVDSNLSRIIVMLGEAAAGQKRNEAMLAYRKDLCKAYEQRKEDMEKSYTRSNAVGEMCKNMRQLQELLLDHGRIEESSRLGSKPAREHPRQQFSSSGEVKKGVGRRLHYPETYSRPRSERYATSGMRHVDPWPEVRQPREKDRRRRSSKSQDVPSSRLSSPNHPGRARAIIYANEVEFPDSGSDNDSQRDRDLERKRAWRAETPVGERSTIEVIELDEEGSPNRRYESPIEEGEYDFVSSRESDSSRERNNSVS